MSNPVKGWDTSLLFLALEMWIRGSTQGWRPIRLTWSRILLEELSGRANAGMRAVRPNSDLC